VQLSPLVRFWFYEDLCKPLRASLERVRLVGRYKGRGVARPASRRTLKSDATAEEWQGDLDRVVGVKTSWFTSQTNPQATPAPQ